MIVVHDAKMSEFEVNESDIVGEGVASNEVGEDSSHI